MTWQKKLKHRFVARIPRTLEQGVLYISMEYTTAAHSCACGCGEEVMTPFSPTDWKMTFDGETVSLWPSVGNWQLPCRSHYVIDNGQIIRAGTWTQRQIAAEQARDKAAKARYYGTIEHAATAPSSTPSSPVYGTDTSRATHPPASALCKRRAFWLSILDILRGRR